MFIPPKNGMYRYWSIAICFWVSLNLAGYFQGDLWFLGFCSSWEIPFMAHPDFVHGSGGVFNHPLSVQPFKALPWDVSKLWTEFFHEITTRSFFLAQFSQMSGNVELLAWFTSSLIRAASPNCAQLWLWADLDGLGWTFRCQRRCREVQIQHGACCCSQS